MENQNTVVDAGDALAWQTTTQTQEITSNEVQQQEAQQTVEAEAVDTVAPNTTTNTNSGVVWVNTNQAPQKTKPLVDPVVPQNANTESMNIQQQAEYVEQNWSLDTEGVEENKEESQEQEESQTQSDEEQTKQVESVEEQEVDEMEDSDLIYIKNNPEQVFKLIKDLQQSKFSNKYKTQHDILSVENETLREKVKELQTEKYNNKYDDSNLPVLETQRGLWRSQNKYYSEPDNEALKEAYVRRLQEEIEDLSPQWRTVSTQEVQSSTPQPKEGYQPRSSYGRVGVKVKQSVR